MFASLVTLAQVLLIDLALAGDNAVVLGLAVARLPPADRHRAILLGTGAAAALRVGLALVAVRLLGLIGLTLAGGLLLLWVCWRSFRELRGQAGSHDAGTAGPGGAGLRGAAGRILLADLSMSLDNVLAVAGAAREHPAVLVAGLVMSVLLVGAAASLVARLLARVPALAWVGLTVVLYVALRMVWDGTHQVAASL